jgi:hypothetical protein
VSLISFTEIIQTDGAHFCITKCCALLICSNLYVDVLSYVFKQLVNFDELVKHFIVEKRISIVPWMLHEPGKNIIIDMYAYLLVLFNLEL